MTSPERLASRKERLATAADGTGLSSCPLHMPTHPEQNPSREAGRLWGGRLGAGELQSRSALCFLAKSPTNPLPRWLPPPPPCEPSLITRHG